MQLQTIAAAVKVMTKTANASDPETQQLVSDSLNLAYYEVAREGKIKGDRTSVVLTPTVDTSDTPPVPMALPDNFLIVDRVIFREGSIISEWEIPEFDGRLVPAPPQSFSKPTAYQLTTATTFSGGVSPPPASPYMGMILIPHAFVATNDIIYLSYYKLPAAVDWASSDLVLLQEVANEIVARAVNYIFTYQNKLEQGRQMMAPILQRMQPAE